MFSQTVGVIASAVGILVTGWLGDRVIRRAAAARRRRAAGRCWRFRSTPRSPTGTMNLTLLLRRWPGVCAGLTNGSFAVLLTDLFPTRVRFSGVALVFNVELHDVQRHRAAGGDEADPRAGPRPARRW